MLNNRDTAIVLAALRIAQEEGMERLNAMPQITVDLADKPAVTTKEIDRLCRRINMPDKPKKKPMRFRHTGARS